MIPDNARKGFGVALIGASLSLLIPAAPASAATLSGGTCTNPFAGTEINQSCTFNLFDTLGGTRTLTGAQLILGGDYRTSLQLTNNAVQSQTVTATTIGIYNLTPPPGLNTGSNPFLTLSLPFGTSTIPSGATVNLGPITANGSNTFNYAGAALSFFTSGAPGTFSIAATTVTGLSLLGGGGQVASQQTTSADFFGSLEYTYDQAPPNTNTVPGPLPIAGAAAAFGFSRRLRKRINANAFSA